MMIWMKVVSTLELLRWVGGETAHHEQCAQRLLAICHAVGGIAVLPSYKVLPLQRAEMVASCLCCQ